MPSAAQSHRAVTAWSSASSTDCAPNCSAAANTVSQSAYHYRTSDFCQKGTSKVVHGGTNNGGWEAWNDNRTRAWIYGVGWVNCIKGFKRPPGWITNRGDYLIWLNGEWQGCVVGSWIPNKTEVTRLVTGRNYYTAPCGARYYGAYVGTYTWYNSDWRGGWLWSSYHYFPSSSSAQNLGSGIVNDDGSTADSSAPGPPPWVRGDGTIDRTKMPERIRMADRNGQPATDSNGNPISIPTAELWGPPPPGPLTPDPTQVSYVTFEEDDVITEHVILTED